MLFKMWPEQRELYDSMWYKNVCLKARQLGCTTFIQLFMLDKCLFQPDTSAGVIAHTAKDAASFFSHKIKFAYDNLPPEIKEKLRADTSNKHELGFSNGSRISVGTSLRSSTLQYLHISEYGKLCAQWPEKAEEVRSGALNTVAPDGFVFIESTAEGRQGHFFDVCQTAMRSAESGEDLSIMDYRFIFFGWWRNPAYSLKRKVKIPDEMREYFDKIETEDGIRLQPEQKYWYVKKAEEQGENMKPEFPATPREAFEKLLQGAIFGAQVQRMRSDGRIEKLPHERGVPVDAFWDLGYNDINAIWFRQTVGAWDHFIDYYENRLVDLTHYIEALNDLHEGNGYQWGTMYLPHDGTTRHITAVAGSAADILRRNGFKVRVVDRPVRKVPSIEATRKRFPSCRFDKDKCEQGIIHLENYAWLWDDKGETYRQSPIHNTASNGADAFQTYGWWHGLHGGDGRFAEQKGQSRQQPRRSAWCTHISVVGETSAKSTSRTSCDRKGPGSMHETKTNLKAIPPRKTPQGVKNAFEQLKADIEKDDVVLLAMTWSNKEW